MFRRILIPLDGSTFAEHALAYGVRIAAATGAELELALVHVSYVPATTDLTLRDAVREWEQEHRRREADYLASLAERLGTSTGGTVRPLLLNGTVVSALEQAIRDRDIDLVVLTTHGRAGIERAWLGSVADALVRQVEPPLLMIRPTDTAPLPVSGERRFSHVLVALDGSERAQRAVQPACEIARADGARVTLLRVASPPMAVTSPFMPHALQLTREEQHAREGEARSYIEGRVADLAAAGVDVKGDALLDYHPAHAILQYAEANGADLIALGAHGRGPIGRLLLGSVSDKVVRGAGVPVLVC